ncbi:YggT family protein [Pseudomonas sp. O64]|uniref:YggT family protein n=1 Tax=Pseudomonas TaxID=286 RepID=UPI000BA095B2|nr:MULTISPECIES: YggT family protein [unclassified Pseudomonas]MCV2225764.1 YggT family protein [Pseudomonas sp. AU10]OZO06022.1 YggT family protein [Pseudomonas sp. IB20]UNM19710.1 YggT family protein [Pseudomonas sp. ArH3a]UXZ22470.1 YggT family protein [Pseudomonas sp. YeP6b]
MLGLNDAVIFIIKTLGSLYLLIVLMRFILQVVRANFYNPLCQFVVKATQPLLKPLRRIVPSMFGLDMSSLVLAFLLQLALFAVVVVLKGSRPDTVLMVPWALIGILSLFLKILFWSMIISVILSWVAPDSRSPGAELVKQITEPVLAPFRRWVPNLGGLDISPIFAFIALQLLQIWVIPYLAEFTGMPPLLYSLI